MNREEAFPVERSARAFERNILTVAVHRDVPGPFVGRVDELATLTQLRLESHRYGRFALIAGEPGMGKSRLVNEFLRDVPRGRAAICMGRALEHVRSPFGPWVSALEAAAPAAAQAIRPNSGFGNKAAMYDAVIDALRECAQRRSTILVLEDLHWADEGSLDLLNAVLSELQSFRRVLLLATVRPAEARETLRRIIADPRSRVLELRPLGSRECVDLVRSLLPGNHTSAERIAALSGGNPFFATELARNGKTDDIPLTLSSAIESRIAPLNAGELSALEAGAVLGEYFELQLLADVLNTAPAAASKRLQSAEREGIVFEHGHGAFRFAHALTRAVLAARLTSAERIDMHKRAAEALERRERFDAVGFAQLAYHYAGAHERDKAYAYQMRAGGLAYSVHAYVDAATFYADAAACAVPGSLERARALARQGDALIRTSVMDAAERAYLDAIAIYRAAGSVDEAAPLYQSLARSLYNQDRVRDALVFIERAVTELAPLPGHLNDELSVQAAFFGADLGPEVGIHWLKRVDEHAVRATRTGGAYYAIRGAIEATQGDAAAWKQTLAAFQENVSMVAPDGIYVGHFGNLASNALFLGLPAMALYEQCFALARSLKLEVFEAAFASHAAFERWLHGDGEAFSRYAAFAAAHDAPIPALHAYVLLNAMLADPAAIPASRDVEGIIAGGHNEFFGPLAGVYARRLARGGDNRAAQRILDAATERLEQPYGAWELLTAMAEFGSRAARERAHVLLAPYRDASAPAFAATAETVAAIIAQHHGDAEEHERAAKRARTLYAKMGWVRHAGRTARPAPEFEQRFSAREIEIARLLQEGCTNREMAGRLFISEKTVEKHLARLYEKLQVNNRAAAVRALSRLSMNE